MRTWTMRKWIPCSIGASLLALVILAPAASAQNAPAGGRAGRNAAPPPPSLPHDPHDLSGVWLQSGRGPGNGSPKLGSEWIAGELPLTPAGLAKLNGNHPAKGPRGDVPAKGNDPISTANVPGLLRSLVYTRPFEFLQTGEKIVQNFEWFRIWREIWNDGRKMPEDPGPRFYGYSVAKWDGDVLDVETFGLDA